MSNQLRLRKQIKQVPWEASSGKGDWKPDLGIKQLTRGGKKGLFMTLLELFLLGVNVCMMDFLVLFQLGGRINILLVFFCPLWFGASLFYKATQPRHPVEVSEATHMLKVNTLLAWGLCLAKTAFKWEHLASKDSARKVLFASKSLKQRISLS